MAERHSQQLSSGGMRRSAALGSAIRENYSMDQRASMNVTATSGLTAGGARQTDEISPAKDHPCETACKTAIPTQEGVFATVLSQDEGPKVWSASPGGAVIIRDAVSCEQVGRIEDVHATAICVAGNNKIWVGRANGKINIYDPCGTVCTQLQESSSAQAPISLFCVYGDRVWSVAASKDVVEWDAARFSLVQVLWGQQAGDVVRALCHGRIAGKFALFAGTRQRIKMWIDGSKEGPSTEGGSHSIVYVPQQSQLWAASDGGIVVYKTSEPGLEQLVQVKTIQISRPVLQLLYIPSGSRLWAFDGEQVTVYNTMTHATVQSHLNPVRIGGGGVGSRNAFVSHRREVTKVWIVSDDGMRIKVWDAAVNAPVEEPPRIGDRGEGDGESSQELEAARAEIQYLKKKVKYIQSVGTIFRQRIGILFREKFRQRDYAATADLGDAESLYRQALADMSNQGLLPAQDGVVLSPSRHPAGGGEPGGHVEQLSLKVQQLQEALNEQLSANARSAQATDGMDVERQIKVWKEEAQKRADELQAQKAENERLCALLHDVGPQKDIDIKRAHHICQVLKEKNQLKEKESALTQQIEDLKKKNTASEERFMELKNNLGDYFWNNQQQGSTQSGDAAMGRGISAGGGEGREAQPQFGSGMADTGAGGVEVAAKEKQFGIMMDNMREDNEKLRTDLMEAQRKLMSHNDEVEECKKIRKTNCVLRERLRDKMKEINSQRLDKTSEQTEMQSNIEILNATINQHQNDLGAKDKTIQELSADKLRLMQDISRMNTILERYKTKVLNLEREQISRSKAEQIQEREHRKETQTLCTSLEGREGKIQQLHSNFVDISEQLQHQVQQVARTNHELDLMSRENMTLKSKLQQLDMLLEERRHFAALLGEVQGRMEMAVEELKRAQSTAELAAEVQNLEQRIAGLTALEGQLKQKDDLIAVKDDEIQKLKLKLAMFERNVNNISAVFLQFPHSLEEMETQIIENEEYKKMAGQSAELEERVKLRQLELKARRAQAQQHGVARALHAGVMGSVDAATAALLARTAEDSDSDDDESVGIAARPHPPPSGNGAYPAAPSPPGGVGGGGDMPPPSLRMM